MLYTQNHNHMLFWRCMRQWRRWHRYVHLYVLLCVVVMATPTRALYPCNVSFAGARSLCGDAGMRLCTTNEIIVDAQSGVQQMMSKGVWWTQQGCLASTCINHTTTLDCSNASAATAAPLCCFESNRGACNSTLVGRKLACTPPCRYALQGTKNPTRWPTLYPSKIPTPYPSKRPTRFPTPFPTRRTRRPTPQPSWHPTLLDPRLSKHYDTIIVGIVASAIVLLSIVSGFCCYCRRNNRAVQRTLELPETYTERYGERVVMGKPLPLPVLPFYTELKQRLRMMFGGRH